MTGVPASEEKGGGVMDGQDGEEKEIDCLAESLLHCKDPSVRERPGPGLDGKDPDCFTTYSIFFVFASLHLTVTDPDFAGSGLLLHV